ncbi:hypothetical protein [Paraburkholderia sp. 31.1]|uniref:hypothetical protein n=1 Tax=unclassified Paraburkholderia TaxID=2615204 RepID=UPI0016558A4D|nr:hypothetical protein [Paraburkholderia sp. 31.1]MBC8725740.1 hypothetical protein [Paraburkholderia sp. 31.1]
MGHMFLVCTLEKACFVVLENEHNEGKYKKVLELHEEVVPAMFLFNSSVSVRPNRLHVHAHADVSGL